MSLPHRRDDVLWHRMAHCSADTFVSAASQGRRFCHLMPLQMQPVQEVAASENHCYVLCHVTSAPQIYCHVIAMFLPCYCHAIAMSMKSDKNACGSLFAFVAMLALSLFWR
jgi:hypothetical protein